MRSRSSQFGSGVDKKTNVLERRIEAQVVDWIVSLLALAVILLALGPLASSQGAVYLLTIGSYFGYNVALEGFWNGQTVGKRMRGIEVLNEQGDPASFIRIVIRNLPAIFAPGVIAYLVAIISIKSDSKHRRLFDQAAGTIVARTE